MNWITLVLTATVIWAIAAVINKFVRVSYIENSLGYIIFIAPVALFSLILLFFEPFVFLNIREAFLAILTGVAAIAGYYLYIEALHKEELSKVFILYGTTPLFVLILSSVFIKEILTIRQYIAFFLIFLSSIFISIKKVEQKIRLTVGALLVLLSALFFSIQNVVLKYVSEINLTTMMIYREIGILVSILLVFLFSSKARRYTKKVIKDLNLKQTALVYSAEIMGMTGMFLIYLAIQKGSVSLVSVIVGLEPIFIFILTILISIFFPRVLKEEINKKTIFIKIISIILMSVGLYLISV